MRGLSSMGEGDLERLEEKIDKLHKKMEEIEGQVKSNSTRFRKLSEDYNNVRYEVNELERKVERRT